MTHISPDPPCNIVIAGQYEWVKAVSVPIQIESIWEMQMFGAVGFYKKSVWLQGCERSYKHKHSLNNLRLGFGYDRLRGFIEMVIDIVKTSLWWEHCRHRQSIVCPNGCGSKTQSGTQTWIARERGKQGLNRGAGRMQRKANRWPSFWMLETVIRANHLDECGVCIEKTLNSIWALSGETRSFGQTILWIHKRNADLKLKMVTLSECSDAADVYQVKPFYGVAPLKNGTLLRKPHAINGWKSFQRRPCYEAD